MSINMNPIDRGIRIVLGVVLVSLFFFGPESAWGLLGLVPLITGLIGYCPLYRVLGITTCSLGSPPRAQN